MLEAIRRTKTTEQRSMRAVVALATITGTDDDLRAVALVQGDLSDAGVVERFELVSGDALGVAAELAPDPAV